jgi:hypothetical protein
MSDIDLFMEKYMFKNKMVKEGRGKLKKKIKKKITRRRPTRKSEYRDRRPDCQKSWCCYQRSHVRDGGTPACGNVNSQHSLNIRTLKEPSLGDIA